MVLSQSGQIYSYKKKKKTHKKRTGGVAQGVGPECKPQYWEKEKKKLAVFHINT
jgi:hypothetical protein